MVSLDLQRAYGAESLKVIEEAAEPVISWEEYVDTLRGGR